MSTDVPKLPQLTPDGANPRATWSRAAVATQTAGFQPIRGRGTFFALRVTTEQNNNSVFHEMLSSDINHGSFLILSVHICQKHNNCSWRTLTRAPGVFGAHSCSFLFPLVESNAVVPGHLSAVRLTPSV